MKTVFGRMPDGRSVERVTLESGPLKVGLITFGASVQSVEFHGAQLVLGSDDLRDYFGSLKYAGAIVGRVANRIAGARATIAKQVFEFDVNESSGNCLHGGSSGAGQQLWEIAEHGPTYAIFTLHLSSAHMGFPGVLDVRATYTLTGSVMRLEITALSDAQTLCSFAPHSYWNLSGEADINAHAMRVAAAHYLPLDAQQIPTGEIADVAGTTFDFRNDRRLGSTALDHNFCLSTERVDLRAVLWLTSAASGVGLEIATTEAGVQVYDGRHFETARAGVAIEPQVWPDSVNQTGFPSMALGAGETYRAVSEFRLCKTG